MGQPPNSQPLQSVNDFVDERLNAARIAYKIVREQLHKAAERQKHYYDLRVKKTSYHVGDQVWLWKMRRKNGSKTEVGTMLCWPLPRYGTDRTRQLSRPSLEQD
jgi:hypothetical protein